MSIPILQFQHLGLSHTNDLVHGLIGFGWYFEEFKLLRKPTAHPIRRLNPIGC